MEGKVFMGFDENIDFTFSLESKVFVGFDENIDFTFCLEGKDFMGFDENIDFTFFFWKVMTSWDLMKTLTLPFLWNVKT